MKENNKKYSAIDFARYHSGEMLPDEMHALEKAALEDPFIADALDGYINSKNAEKELDEIRMRLDEKTKRQKVFSINSLSSGAWWKIAAMFILFAGAGYFFYATNSKKEASLGVKDNVLQKQNPATLSPATDDSLATRDNIAFEKAPPGKNENSTHILPTPTAEVTETLARRKTLPEQIRAEKESSITMNSDKAISLKVIAKDSGKISFFDPLDTAALVAASPAISKRNNDITREMNKQNATLNEVVVTGYGAQKKKSITEAKLEGKVSGVKITTSAPYPKDGKEKFNQYINDNAVPVFDSTGERITANILLSFTLNKKCKPAHIKVLESSCEVCDKEAIRLLKNGPPWIGKRGDSGTVRIKF